MNKRPLFAIVAVTATLLLAAGCECHTPPQPALVPPPDDFLQNPDPVQREPQAQMQLPGYRLNFGDELEIIYQIRHDMQRGEYQLQIEDRINIRFPFQPEFNQAFNIPSDGNLNLLLVDKPINAVGLTVAELVARIRQEYAKHIQNPQLTVVVDQANVKVEELKRTITTAPRGQSRLVPVAPDGRLSLPYVPSIMAYGRTIPELTMDLNEAYRSKNIEGIEVSVNVLNVSPIKVYIMGEVARPGLHNLRHHATLVQAIGEAGGWVRGRADASKVLLVRRRGMPVPTGAVINVAYLNEGLGSQASGGKAIDFAAHRFDPFVQDDDIIYVPSNQLAKNADWIRIVFTQGIYGVLPFSASVSYTMTDNVDWLRPNENK